MTFSGNRSMEVFIFTAVNMKDTYSGKCNRWDLPHIVREKCPNSDHYKIQDKELTSAERKGSEHTSPDYGF